MALDSVLEKDFEKKLKSKGLAKEDYSREELEKMSVEKKAVVNTASGFGVGKSRKLTLSEAKAKLKPKSSLFHIRGHLTPEQVKKYRERDKRIVDFGASNRGRSRRKRIY